MQPRPQICTDYAVVARFASPIGGKRVVLLSGAHTYGTIAAARFLARNRSPVWRRSDTLWILEVQVVDGSVGKVEVVHREPIGKSKSRLERRHIRVKEAYCDSAGGDKPLEDHVVLDTHLVGVIDGVTFKGTSTAEPHTPTIQNVHTEYPSPGAAAARLISSALLANAPRSSPVSKAEFVDIASKAIAEYQSVDGMAAVGAFFHLPSGKIWRIGDITVRINGRSHPPRPNLRNDLLIDKRVKVLQDLIDGADDRVRKTAELRADDEGRQSILSELRACQDWANKDYAVIDGRGIPLHLVEEFDVPLGAEVILASDGFACVESTLKETLRTHEDLVANDPLCYGVLRGTKAVAPGSRGFDDMSYLRFIHEGRRLKRTSEEIVTVATHDNVPELSKATSSGTSA